MTDYDFSVSPDVNLIGVELSKLSENQLEVLYQQARYCQAMTEADTHTMKEVTSADLFFTHMSGRQQTREEYLADVAAGRLRYFTAGIENPVIEVSGDHACVTCTSVLNASAYGVRGVYRMPGTHWWQRQDGVWRLVNGPSEKRTGRGTEINGV